MNFNNFLKWFQLFTCFYSFLLFLFAKKIDSCWWNVANRMFVIKAIKIYMLNLSSKNNIVIINIIIL